MSTRGTAGQSRETLLQSFVDWSATHITGDEKGQAQIFLDRLFQAFGQKGSLDVGGTAEMRIRKDKDSGGGTSFADYVWKPVVLIEMKRRGADLSKHYRQAFDYWVRLVPDRPQYVVLCNFDEFWVYDFNNQLDSPKGVVKLTELATAWGPLAFLFPTNEPPKFGNDREAVTREVALKLDVCILSMLKRGVERDLAQRFILQTLVALFAEDIGLLPRYLFKSLLDESDSPADSYDLIGGLFEAMNSPTSPAGGRYKGVRYFNGGIFAKPAQLEINTAEQLLLVQAASADWSKVSPEIFGAIFQNSLSTEERHAFGAHYTSPVDIMKIVKPTISDPWTAAIDAAKSEKKLNELLGRLARLRVLDPACGSGNFLYLAYREMKRLETRIRERLRDEFPGSQPVLDHVNAKQFHGMDVNAFAIELAKVSMMIARKLAIDELHIADEKDLPLDNLDKNFTAVDALMTTADGPSGAGTIQTSWPPADVIIGNPPFLGSRFMAKERGYPYVRALHRLYPGVPKMADYCVYWFRRAHDHIASNEKANTLAGRAGLVGTNKIRQGESREASLDYVTANGGTIVDAVSTQVWSGDANVHVSIVNWVKGNVGGLKRISTQIGDDRNSGNWKVEEVPEITGSLSSATDASAAKSLSANEKPKLCYQGQIPCHDGFLLEPAAAKAMLRRDPRLGDVTFPWPQSPTAKQVGAVAAAAVEVRRVRGEALRVTTGGLRAVYRTLELPGKHPLKDAHAALDAAVLAAYGFAAKKDLLAQLLELNLAVAAKEKAGEPVTPPGVPAAYGDAGRLVTGDCIKP